MRNTKLPDGDKELLKDLLESYVKEETEKMPDYTYEKAIEKFSVEDVLQGLGKYFEA